MAGAGERYGIGNGMLRLLSRVGHEISPIGELLICLHGINWKAGLNGIARSRVRVELEDI
jgi:tRNA nucleotidyltransferase/poly(A) polymerase